MNKSVIKAVEMARRIRDSHYEQLKDKTPEERIAFYKAKAAHLESWLEEKAKSK